MDKAGPDSDGRSMKARMVQVKNKQPAPVQITAEQILREALDRQEPDYKPPKQIITDAEELADYKLRKRKQFEDALRRNRFVAANWIKYAKWEESQREFERVRSIFERAIDVDYRNPAIWLNYAEFEMRNKNVNHARNVWDRAVTLLPRVSQFWYKYALMEDLMGNYAGARQVFQRWMEWEPDEQAWLAFIKFETRNKEIQRVREIFEKFVLVHATVKNWLRYAKWEETNGELARARSVYERCSETLGDFANDEQFYIAFAKFEERQKEYERARAIYRYALERLPKNRSSEVYKQRIAFEKKFGKQTELEDVVLDKRRQQYEAEVSANSKNYDAWFDYVRLEEAAGDPTRVRAVYDRAVAQQPPLQEKRFWRRYIYLWINYALYEELEAHDMDRTRQVYRRALSMVPHKVFTFSKLWVLFAHFEVRQKNLAAARKVMGTAIGTCPRPKLFRAYIDLEFQLGEVDRCRTLYEKLLSHLPADCHSWVAYAKMEAALSEEARARAIFQLAVNQPVLDTPEVLWKAFIDFEISLERYDLARELYNQLLSRTKHVKVWLSFAQFEAEIVGNPEAARALYAQAYQELKNAEIKEERVLLIEAWKKFEDQLGSTEQQEAVAKKMPQRIKKKRPITTEDGRTAGWEEYFEYIFPDEQAAMPGLKLLERARLWKKQKEGAAQ